MQVDLLSSAQSAHALHLFHQHSPLVHCMTNDVVQTFTANTLLALGASPAMVIETEEASQFAAIASALLINVGTLTQPRAQAMRAAVEQAKRSQTPWTLDPVAVGALDYRRRFCLELLSHKPTAIRGNASEIMALLALLMADGEWIPLTPQLMRYPLHKHWHGKLAQSSWSQARWIMLPMAIAPLAFTVAIR